MHAFMYVHTHMCFTCLVRIYVNMYLENNTFRDISTSNSISKYFFLLAICCWFSCSKLYFFFLLLEILKPLKSNTTLT